MIDLAPPHLELLKTILMDHVPEMEIYIFGSRVDGTSQPYSDIDVALAGSGPLAAPRLEALREALSLSDLPIMVDLVDLRRVEQNFRERVLAHCEPLCLQPPP